MKTAIVNFKTDPKIKAIAQKRAKKLGISLSMVMNDRLRDFAEGKKLRMEFPSEPMTPHMEKLIEESEASGTVGPFDSVDEAIDYLKNLPPDES